MKTITRIFMLGLFLFPICAFAQKATEQREYEVRVEWEDMSGYAERVPYSVPIYYDDDDNVIKHGPIKINYKNDLTSHVRQKCIIAYKVSGNYVNGKLDGALTLEKSATVSAGVLKVKGTLNFVNGEPEGTWTFTESATSGGETMSAKLVMVIEDKKIVSCNINNGEECFTINNNTFSGTHKGKVYKNGVNTSEFIRKTGERTKPDQNAAKLINGYLAGTMSESDLIAKGFSFERRHPWEDFDYDNIRYYIGKLMASHFMDEEQYISYSEAIHNTAHNRDLNPALTLKRVNVKSAEEMIAIANTVKNSQRVSEGTDEITWYENSSKWYRYYYGTNEIEIEREFYYFTDETKLKFEEAIKEILVARHEILDAQEKENCLSFVKETFDNYLLNKTLAEYEARYGYNRITIKNTSIFPVLSYSILGMEKSDNPDVSYYVKIRANVAVAQELTLKEIFTSSKKPKSRPYITYDVVVRVTSKDDRIYAYLDENYVKIRNDYDVINDLDVKIEENDQLIKELAKSSFKSNYNAYTTFRKRQNFSVNDNDLKSSIKAREEMIAVQEGIKDFNEMLGEILMTDANINTKLSDKKDMLKAYQAYVKTRDLSWSPKWDRERLNGYILVQKNCLEFSDLRTRINDNNVKINSKKSSAPNIVKAYTAYSSTCDIAWSPNVDFENINSFISVQERCVALMSQENIAEIDKSVKKQKIKDIEQILSMNTISHSAPAPTTKKESDVKPKAEDKPLVEAKNVEPEPKVEKEPKPAKAKKQNVADNGFRTKGLVNSFELSYNAQFASDRYVSLQTIGHYPYSTVHPIEFNYLIGYRFNNWVSLSFGTGIVCDMVNLRTLDYAMNSINYSGPTYSTLRIPVFLNVKTYMTDTKIQPMASLSVGGTSPSVVDFLDFENWTLSAELGVGCNVRTGNRGNLYFLLSAKMMPMPYFETYAPLPSDAPGQSYMEGWYGPLETVAASIKVGFMF